MSNDDDDFDALARHASQPDRSRSSTSPVRISTMSLASWFVSQGRSGDLVMPFASSRRPLCSRQFVAIEVVKSERPNLDQGHRRER